MVRVWDKDIEEGIKVTKMRIKLLEKHGNGDSVIYEKNVLKKKERHQQIRKDSQ